MSKLFKRSIFIIIFVISFFAITNTNKAYSYTYPEIDWIPNLYFSISYDKSLEGGFSTNRNLYQIITNPGISTGTGMENANNGKISNTPCIPFSVSLLSNRIEDDIKIWEGDFVLSQKVYIIDDTYGVVGTKIYKYLSSFRCYSDKGEPIKYSMKVINDNNEVLYEINDKLREDLMSTIYLPEKQIIGSDFVTGHIGIQKVKSDNCQSSDLTSIWKIYKDGSSEPIKMYGVSSLDKYKYGYTLNQINTLNTYSNLLYTNSKGILNIFDLPKGDYRLEQVSGSNSEEYLTSYNFKISDYGYQYEGGSVISPILNVNMVNINDVKKDEESNNKGANENKDNNGNTKEDSTKKDDSRKDIKPSNPNVIKPGNVNNTNNSHIDLENKEEKIKEDTNDKKIEKKDSSLNKDKKKVSANDKLGIKGSNIKNEEEVINKGNKETLSFWDKLKAVIKSVFSAENNKEEINELDSLDNKEVSNSNKTLFIIPILLMFLIILFPVIINKKKKKDK